MEGLSVLVAPERVLHWLLIATRLGGVVASAPLLSQRELPVRARAGMVAGIALALAKGDPGDAIAGIGDFWTLAGLIVTEAGTGLMIGLVPQLLIGGVTMGGQMAGIHMGLGMTRLIDPVARVSVTPIALWFQFVTMLVFISLDGHHLVIRALMRSFEVLPVGTARMSGAEIETLMGLVGGVFEVAVRVAAPVLAGLLILDTGLGLLSRAIPELNVFILGFAAKIVVAFLLLATSLPFTLEFLQVRLFGLEGDFVSVLGSFG